MEKVLSSLQYLTYLRRWDPGEIFAVEIQLKENWEGFFDELKRKRRKQFIKILIGGESSYL